LKSEKRGKTSPKLTWGKRNETRVGGRIVKGKKTKTKKRESRLRKTSGRKEPVNIKKKLGGKEFKNQFRWGGNCLLEEEKGVHKPANEQ